MSETVIREVVKDVWTFSCPFTLYGLLPIGGRSTAIRLSDGGLWVLASSPLNEETKAKLDELGPVKYLVSANGVHYLFLSDFKKAYPSAKVFASQLAVDKCQDKNLKFDGIWGTDPAETKYEFEPEIQACFFSGYKNRDIAFFHPTSKVLIQADLLFNLPTREQYSKSKSSGYVPSFLRLNPSRRLHQKILRQKTEDEEAMRRDARTVAGWDFEKIIPCHGDVIEKDGDVAWRTAHKDYLD